MYQSSTKYETLIQQPSRRFYGKIVVDGVTAIAEDIRSIRLQGASNSENSFIIGSAIAQYVEVELSNPPMALENHEIEVFIGLEVDGVVEYVSSGFYTVEKPEADEDSISFTAYDRMLKTERAYFSSLSDSTNTIAILNEMASFLGTSIITTGLTSYAMTKPVGYTCREILSYISQLYAGFAICNRKGQIEIKQYKEIDYIVGTDRYWGTFVHNDFTYDFVKITCYTGKDTEGKDIAISAGTGAREMTISNPFMTQAQLNIVYNNLKNFSYMPGTLKFLGDNRLDPWDVIKVLGRDGKTYKVPCMKLVQDFDGGLTTGVEAVGETETEVSQGFKGPNVTALDRVYTKLALVDHAIVNKLDVDVAEINYAKIKDLDVINGKFQTLDADYGKFKTLVAEDFTAAYGKITSLETVTGDITHLVNGNLTSDNILSLNLTAKNTTIENALIKTAVMQSVTVGDLMAGTISTNRFKIMSDNGGIEIVGATQQWRDSDEIIRMQAGQDAKGDFTFAIFNKAGTGVLIDADGIKAGAVPNGLIVNDMVADNANIQGSKVDIKSLVTEINAGNTKILGSTVQLDASGQTLDLAFSQVHEEINAIVSEDGTYLLQVYTEGTHVGDEETAKLYARVYVKNSEATETIPADRFLWTRSSESAEEDAKWNSKQQTGYSITLTGNDVYMVATFSCIVTIPEEYSIADNNGNLITDIDGNEIIGLYV